jgi:uncharacterized protein YbjT (DUF2867 family)
MKKVILTGASGMIGGIVLRSCLESKEIETVTSIARKPSGLKHSKLVEIIHKDFTNYNDLDDVFKNQDAAYFCIGVYTGQVPDAQFKTITVDFTKVFADKLKQHSPDATFCFLSGQGADQKEKSRVAFAKYKGMAENYLIQKNFGQLYIFRPAYIYPVQKREEPNFSYRLFRRLYPLMKSLYPKGLITSEQLGQAMFKAGIIGTTKVVLENQDIKEII